MVKATLALIMEYIFLIQHMAALAILLAVLDGLLMHQVVER